MSQTTRNRIVAWFAAAVGALVLAVITLNVVRLRKERPAPRKSAWAK